MHACNVLLLLLLLAIWLISHTTKTSLKRFSQREQVFNSPIYDDNTDKLVENNNFKIFLSYTPRNVSKTKTNFNEPQH